MYNNNDGRTAVGVAGDGLVLVVVLLCTLLRGSRLYESKRCAMTLLVQAALQCDDEVRDTLPLPFDPLT